MADDDNGPDNHRGNDETTRSKGGGADFSWLNEYHLGGIEQKLKAGKYVDGEELARALHLHGQRPIPQPVLDYLCALLKGKVKKPKGRPARPNLLTRQQNMIIRWSYRRNFAWLRARKKSYGHLDGWPALQGTNFWKGPASEKAARMTAARFGYGAESWRSVLNINSSQD